MAAADPGAPDFTMPDALPILPLRDAVVFPLTAVPLAVGQPSSIRLVDDVMRGNRLIALLAQRDPAAEPSRAEDLHRTGTVGMIHQLARAPDGSIRIMVQGMERIRLLDLVGTDPYLVGRVEPAPDQIGEGTDVEALRLAVVDIFRRLVEATRELPDDLAAAVSSVPEPRHVAYFVASVMPLDLATRQEILDRLRAQPVRKLARRAADVIRAERDAR